MWGDRLWLPLLFGVFVSATSAAAEDAEPPPDEAFLEYLGSWEESDEEWLLYEEMLTLGKTDEEDPAARDEVPTEDEDES